MIGATDVFGVPRTWEYNAVGFVTKYVDAAGLRTDYTYDECEYVGVETTTSFGQPTTIIAKGDVQHVQHFWYVGTSALQVKSRDAENNDTLYSHNADGSVHQVQDSRDVLTTYTYNNRGEVTSTTTSVGPSYIGSFAPVVEHQDYDANGFLCSSDDGDSTHTYTYTNDRLGRILAAVDPADGSSAFTYDAKGNLKTTTDRAGRVTSYEYDEMDRMVRVVNPDGTSRDTIYDAVGNAVAVVDESGNLTRYVYDSSNRRIATINSEGKVTNVDYAGGRVVSSMDPRNNTTSYEYDKSGRLVMTTDALSGQVICTYDDYGNLETAEDARYNVTHYGYDSNNRLHTATDAGGVTTTNYDSVGNVASVVDPYGATTWYGYDGLNRPVLAVDAMGTSQADETRATHYTYDSAGNLRTVTDPLDHVTTYWYDVFNRQTKVTDALATVDGDVNHSTLTRYDAAGNVDQVTDALDRITGYVHDVIGRLVRVTNAMGWATYQVYDRVGNCVTSTDALGRTTYYEYDSMNRQVRVIDPLASRDDDLGNGHTTVMEYDDAGNVSSVTDPGGSVSYQYDRLNRVVSVTDGDGATTSKHYDPAGNVDWTEDARGNKTYYGYDSINRQTSVTEAGFDAGDLEHTTTTTYYGLADGALNGWVKVADPKGHESYTHYDKLGRLDRVTNVGYYADAAGCTTVTAYDADGNVTSVTDQMGRVTRYHYDALNRRVSMTDTAGTTDQASNHTTWTTYDAVGNVLFTTDQMGNSTGYQYDALNQLIETTNAMDAPKGEVVHLRLDDGAGATPLDSSGNDLSATVSGTGAQWSTNGQINGALSLGQASLSVTGLPSTISEFTVSLWLKPSTVTGSHNSTELQLTWGNLVLTVRSDGTVRYGDSILREVGAITTAYWQLITVVCTGYDIGLFRNGVLIDSGWGYLTGAGTLSISSVPGQIDDVRLYSRFLDTESIAALAQGMNRTSTTQHDAVGNVTSTVDASGNRTEYTYDAEDRVVKETVYEGTTPYSTTNVYDAVNLTDTTDRNGQHIHYTYDASGRVTQEDWWNSTNTEITRTLCRTYDADGRLVTATDNDFSGGDLPAVQYFYDEAGRLTATHEDLPIYSGTTHTSGITGVTGAGGRKTVDGLYYDLWPVYLEPGEGNTISVYTGSAKVHVEICDADDVGQAFSYEEGYGEFTAPTAGWYLIKVISDPVDPLPPAQVPYTVEMCNLPGLTTEQEYDADGKKIAVIDDFWGYTNYTYDAHDVLTKQTDGDLAVGKTVHVKYTYNNAGQMTQIDRYDNGTYETETYRTATTTYAYDTLSGRLLTVSSGKTSAENLGKYAVTAYDGDGRIVTLVEGTAPATTTHTYSYSLDGQLLGDQITGGGDSQFAYDESGNPTDNGQEIGPQNQISLDADGGYTYDHNGNLTSKDDGTTHWSYEWDYRNRLTRATATQDEGGGLIEEVEYAYDPVGNRVGQTVHRPGDVNERWTFGYDGDKLRMRWYSSDGEGPGGFDRRFMYGLGEDDVIGTIYTDEDWVARAEWDLKDQLGSVRNVVRRQSGTSTVSVDAMSYTAFGGLASGTLSKAHSFGHAGREYDWETGLYYNKARWYDAGLRRFISQDPSGLAGGDENLYRYGGNDPIGRVDPTGLCAQSSWGTSWGSASFINENILNEYGGGSAGQAAPAGTGVFNHPLTDEQNLIVQGISGRSLVDPFLTNQQPSIFPQEDFSWYDPKRPVESLYHEDEPEGFSLQKAILGLTDWVTSKPAVAVGYGADSISNALTFGKIGPLKEQINQAATDLNIKGTWIDACVQTGANLFAQTLYTAMGVKGVQWVAKGAMGAWAARAAVSAGKAPSGALRAMRVAETDASLLGTRTLGYTTPEGRVFLQPGLSRAEQLATLEHESVHAFFSPKGTGPISQFRQALGQWGYDNSQLLRFTEEAIAETRGSGSLIQGLRHPLVNGYGITLGGVALEGTIYGGSVFGLGYAGYGLGGGK